MQVKTSLAKLGIECKSFNGDLLYEPWEVLDQAGQPHTSFDTFWNGYASHQTSATSAPTE
jgi:deoxyribodipyrimidine photolyase